MICLMLMVTVVASANASNEPFPQPNGFVSSSATSDAFRLGATFALRFLESPNLLPSVFYKVTKERNQVNQGQILLKLLGVDSMRVKDLAVDGVISLVRLMNRVLLKGEEKRSSRKAGKNFSFFRFIMSRLQVFDLLSYMEDPDLVSLILKELEDYPEENTECIKVLICRTEPFVKGMQKSLRFFRNREVSGKKTCEKTEEETCDLVSWEKADLESRMYFFAPSLSQVAEFGHKCDQLFPNCVY